MSNLVAAIDLGTTKVVCLIGEKTASGVNILAMSQMPSKGVSRGEVVNIKQVMDSMLPTIREVEEKSGQKIHEVYVGIAGQNIRCEQSNDQTIRVNPDELISQKEIDVITEKMYGAFCQGGEEVLHAIPQSYNIDDFMGITEPVGMIGKTISSNFKLFIGKKASATFSNHVITRANLKLRELILEPLASAKAILSEEEMEVGVAMVDIGGGTTDLLIIQDGIIRHTAVIPFGGNSITEDIRMGCGISSKQAEALKISQGVCMSSRASEKKNIVISGFNGRENKQISSKLLASIIEARVSEIFEAVDYEIEKSGYKGVLKAGLVITGGTSLLPTIGSLAAMITGLETRLAAPDSATGAIDINQPALSTAVGLAIMGLENMEKHNLKGCTTPIDPQEEQDNATENNGNTEEKKEENKKETPKEPKKERFSFSKLIKGLSNDSMFNDNDA